MLIRLEGSGVCKHARNICLNQDFWFKLKGFTLNHIKINHFQVIVIKEITIWNELFSWKVTCRGLNRKMNKNQKNSKITVDF